MSRPELPLGVAVTLFVSLVLGSCQADSGSDPRSASDARSESPSATELQAMNEDVRAMLDEWVAAFESRDAAAVRAVLADSETFVWLEDGAVRYPTRESVVAALESFPPGLSATYELRDVQLVPLGATRAWLSMGTSTEIRQNDDVVSSFEGVVSMLVEYDGRWRIAAAHTSNQSRRPG